MKRQTGFTLVEMLVVLAILAGTLAISLPYVRSSGDGRDLEATAQTIAARMRQAQAQAVFNNVPKDFKIDIENAKLLDPPFNLPSGTLLKIETAQGLVATNQTAIRFFADGGSTGGKITLSKGQNQLELAINWLDGAIVISKAAKP
jgi:general secretion pathway protein H